MGTVNLKEGRRAVVAERPQAVTRPEPAAPPATKVKAASTTDAERFRPRTQEWESEKSQGAMAKRRPKGLGRAHAMGRRSPEMAAIVLASFGVSLACLYVAAYARVTAESFEKVRLEQKLKDARVEEDALHAEVSRLQMPESIRARALSLGLVPEEKPALNLIQSNTPAASADTPKE